MKGCINMNDNLLNPPTPCAAARELGARVAAALAVLEDDAAEGVLMRNKTARLLLQEALRYAEARPTPA